MDLIIGFALSVSEKKKEEKKKRMRVLRTVEGAPLFFMRSLEFGSLIPVVKIRPRKACGYPNLRSFRWDSYDNVGILYSGDLRNRSEARASDLRSHPGLWWNRIMLRLYEGKESEYSPRTCSICRPAGGTLCPHQ